MNKTLVPLLSLALIIAVGGCKKNSSPSNTANVAFVNGTAGTSGIDAKVNNTTVGGAANIGFKGNSGYKSVAEGTVTMGYYLTNVGTLVSTQSVNLTAGSFYSAFSGGLITAPTFLLVSDDLAAPASNSAKIRFVNLSPDALSVNALAQTTTFATTVTSNKASAYYTIAAGTYEIKAGDPGNIASVVSAGNQQLGAGKIYTVMLTGSMTSTGASALALTVLNNN